MHLIGLDVGTTGCKAIVFDPHGAIRGTGFREYDVICTEPAMGEQDAERVWRHHQPLRIRGGSLQRRRLQRLSAASGQHHGVALVQQGQCGLLADSGSRAGDDGDLAR
jgi:sugar (pentulose or hexulose) kinase